MCNCKSCNFNCSSSTRIFQDSVANRYTVRCLFFYQNPIGIVAWSKNGFLVTILVARRFVKSHKNPVRS